MHMATPSIAVAALAVAIYAALVASVTGLVQVFNYRRDRAQIVLTVGHDMVIATTLMREGLTIVNVMNRGRRPVTITTVGAWRLHPHKPFVIPETHPDLPYELKEGQKLGSIRCDWSQLQVRSGPVVCAPSVGRPVAFTNAPHFPGIQGG
jgi:hypothetical protein